MSVGEAGLFGRTNDNKGNVQRFLCLLQLFVNVRLIASLLVLFCV